MNMELFLCIFSLVATATSASRLQEVLKYGNDQFTAKMFQEVIKAQKGKSCVLSAFSVLSPLAQLALASTGITHEEILATIGFPNNNVTKDVFVDVNARLESIKGVELKQANKIYVRDGYTLNNNFAAMTKMIFNSEVQNIDFRQNEWAANEINLWVEEHTNRRIKDLVDADSIDELTVAILVNAIYFKGKWKNSFNCAYTHHRNFHVTKEKTAKVPMMYQQNNFKYINSQELDAAFLEMEYDGGEASLVIALPNKIDGINNLIKKLKNPAALNNALSNMSTVEVSIYLPKFKIETTTDLKDILENMNIETLFDPYAANLQNLLTQKHNLYISSATQKAFIEVDELGAEAAATNDIFESQNPKGPPREKAIHFQI